MLGIPIVVSRLTNNGTKEIFTVRDTVMNDQTVRNNPKLTNEFLMIENNNHGEREKQSKVRIRRIQSSGSRRKFPKDFFSRQSYRPNHNTVLKENIITQSFSKDLETMNSQKQQGNSQMQQTPKFKQKQPISNTLLQTTFKNRTLRQTINKCISNNPIEIKSIPIVPIISFENTFSIEELKRLNWKSGKGEQKRVMNVEKQSSSVKKYKIKKGYLTRKTLGQRNLPE